MTSKTAEAHPIGPPLRPEHLLGFGSQSPDAILNVQKELLDVYSQTAQAWVNRVQSEVKFWSELATRLSASRSVPEGLEAYRDGVAERMQMAIEDGRRMFEEGQKIIAAATTA